MSTDRRGGRRLKFVLAGGAIALVLAIVFAATACHGHVIRRANLPDGAADFDFRQPPCAPGPQPTAETEDVLLRYLGVSGVYIQWRGVALLTAPFFSRYSGRQVAVGSVDPDVAAIERGMAGLPGTPIRAVIVGHSHYDHFGDLQVILQSHAPEADVYVNQSGRNMLEGAPGIDNAFVDVGPSVGTWIRLRDKDNAALPVRLMPIESAHARQAPMFRFATGEVGETWRGLTGHKLRDMKGGRTYAYLIDLLDEDDAVAFRLHYQDAASAPPLGFPPPDAAGERPVDVAIVCMASYWHAPGYPVELLGSIQARHALMTHYEDFFRPSDRPLRFVPMLTDRRANALLGMVRDAVAPNGAVGPASEVCGPGDDGWTMPLPGAWLRFPTDPD